MRALHAARALGLASWCIGAGTIRNLVWDHLHAFEHATVAADTDLVFYDLDDRSRARELALEQALLSAAPEFRWEAVNQAAVHHWLQPHDARTAPPLSSLDDGVASWPEFATCVGVTLSDAGELGIIAPHGLHDLFHMIVRCNCARVACATYRDRMAAKRFSERWPQVQVLPC